VELFGRDLGRRQKAYRELETGPCQTVRLGGAPTMGGEVYWGDDILKSGEGKQGLRLAWGGRLRCFQAAHKPGKRISVTQWLGGEERREGDLSKLDLNTSGGSLGRCCSPDRKRKRREGEGRGKGKCAGGETVTKGRTGKHRKKNENSCCCWQTVWS